MGPQKLKTRGKLPTLTNLPPSGTQGVGGSSANEGGENLGVQGGIGGCPPQNKN